MVRMIKKYLLASLAVSLLSLSLTSLHAQVTPAALLPAHVVGGGFVSDYSPDYGPNRLLGLGHLEQQDDERDRVAEERQRAPRHDEAHVAVREDAVLPANFVKHVLQTI